MLNTRFQFKNCPLLCLQVDPPLSGSGALWHSAGHVSTRIAISNAFTLIKFSFKNALEATGPSENTSPFNFHTVVKPFIDPKYPSLTCLTGLTGRHWFPFYIQTSAK